MNIRKKFLFPAMALSVMLTQCKVNDIVDEKDADFDSKTTEIGTLKIPEGFNFSTSKIVDLEIGGAYSKRNADGMVKYSIYLYDEKYNEDFTFDENGLMSNVGTTINYNTSTRYKITSIVTNSSQSIKVEVPTHIENLLIIKDDYGSISSKIIPLANFGKKSSASVTFETDISDIGDMAYAELGRKQFTINPDGSTTQLTDFPESIDGIKVMSAGLAIDSRNNIKYNVNIFAPYQIIKSSIGKEDYEFVGNAGGKGQGIGFPTSSLMYNDHDKSLYSIELNQETGNIYLHRIDPIFGGHSDKKWLLTVDLFGKPLVTSSVGDITVCNDGDVMFSTPDGIYEVQRVDNDLDELQVGLYEHTDEHHGAITGMGIVSDNRLAINNNNDGTLGFLDYEGDNPGEYTKVVGPGVFLSDLAIFRSKLAEFKDQDEDGISDYYDEYPLNPELAFNEYCPSLYGHYTVISEDLWPSKGDYDFNDLVVGYKSKKEMNSARLVVIRRMDLTILHIGGSFANGFGIKWNEKPSTVTSYTSTHKLTDGIIALADNGLEAGHKDEIVQIYFDNAKTLGIGNKVSTITEYNPPIECPTDAHAFIFINGKRDREVSFMNKMPTELAGLDYFGTYSDVSDLASGLTYQSKNKLPWMIRLTDEVKYIPSEKVKITDAFLKFREWAESGGESFKDWNLDMAGYRDAKNMQQLFKHEH
ncbi:MAG: LruC domain-containing protein [Ichthyobacteriaceae bacterium]|nr:LruC domain-containing protein [Ichthyobacteriaceae bacterium]